MASAPTRIDNITHILLLQMKPDISALERRAVFEELYALKNKCVATATSKPYIKAIVGGKEISIEELNNGVTHVFLIDFETPADRDYYVKEDPAHKAFVENNSKFIEKTQVVEFSPYRL